MLIIAILFIVGVAVFVYGYYLDSMDCIEYADIGTFYNADDQRFYFYIKDKRDN